MSGVVKRPADLPALVTVNVPPRSSSGASLPFCAASARRLMSASSSSSERESHVAHDGNDEPLLGLHGDPEVVALEIDELVVLDARVQLRELAQRLRDRLQHERQEQLHVDAREVALLDPGDRRDLAVRAREVLEHLPLDPADRLAPAVLRPDVRLGDPPVRPGALDRRQVDAELLGEPAHKRRHAHLSGARLRAAVSAPLFGASRRPADHDEHRPDRNDFAFGDENRRTTPAGRRRDLDRRLVGRDLDERVVLRDLLALLHEPARDLAFGEALAEIGQLELVGHGRIPT